MFFNVFNDIILFKDKGVLASTVSIDTFLNGSVFLKPEYIKDIRTFQNENSSKISMQDYWDNCDSGYIMLMILAHVEMKKKCLIDIDAYWNLATDILKCVIPVFGWDVSEYREYFMDSFLWSQFDFRTKELKQMNAYYTHKLNLMDSIYKRYDFSDTQPMSKTMFIIDYNLIKAHKIMLDMPKYGSAFIMSYSVEAICAAIKLLSIVNSDKLDQTTPEQMMHNAEIKADYIISIFIKRRIPQLNL